MCFDVVFVHSVETLKVYVSEFSIRNPESLVGLRELASGENLTTSERGRDSALKMG